MVLLVVHQQFHAVIHKYTTLAIHQQFTGIAVTRLHGD